MTSLRNSRRDPTASRPPASTMLVVAAPLFALSFSRWGSYLGLPAASVFLPDLLLIAGAIGYAIRAAEWRPHARPRPRSTTSGWMLALTLTYVLIWFLASTSPLGFRIRDIAPFLYLATLPLMARALYDMGSRCAMRYLRLACWAHICWGLPAALGVLDPVSLLPSTISGQPLFELRDDVDASVFTVSLLVAAVGAGRKGKSRTPDWILGTSSVVALLMQSSRTGVFGLAVAALLMAMVYRPWKSDSLRAVNRVTGAALAACLTFAIVSFFPTVLPQSGVLARLGLGTGAEASQLASGASGTARARWTAWKLVTAHTNSSPARILFGEGPGSNPIAESGALAHLSGDPTVRAPHSWPVGLYARFGLVGIVAWTSCLTALLLRRYRPARTESHLAEWEKARALWPALAASLALAACVGVVVESPFGALPLSLACAGVSVCRSVTPLLGGSSPPTENKDREYPAPTHAHIEGRKA